MGWVTVIWSMVASACLTLAAVHLLGWCQRRSQWAYLLFAIAAAGTAGLSAVELWMMHAATPAQLATAVRWLHVPTWTVFVALVGIVRVYLRAGRLWLGWTVCALRTLSLLLDFLTGQNLNYLQINRLRPVPFLGEFVSVAEGAPNPWMILGQLSLYLFVIFAADAAVTVWRRGERSRAMTMGGSIVFFMLVGGVHSAFCVRAVTDAPFFASPYFLGVLAAMAWEMSREAIRAAQLADNLRESEARYRGIFDGAVEGMFRTTVSGKILLANAALAEMLGYDSAEELTREVDNTASQVWAEPGERGRFVRQVEQQDAMRAYECRFRRKDGTAFWVSLSTRAVRGPGGSVACYDGFVVDISGRKEAEEALNENRVRCAMGAELAGLGFYDLGEGENVRHVDDRVRAICGFPSDIAGGALVLKFWLDHLHPDDFPRIRDAHLRLFDGRLDRASVEYRYLHPDQRTTWVHHIARVTKRNGAGQRISEIGVMRDITEQKRAEIEEHELRRELTHVTRVSMMGELAASMAHELNQPLAAILSNAQAARRFLAAPETDTSQIREILDDIVKDDKRAGEVIHRLRALVQKQSIVADEPVDFNELILDTRRLLNSELIGRAVQVELALAPSLPAVLSGRVELQQVLINLMVNAADAMRDQPPQRRRLKLETSAANGKVRLAVRDWGPGIPDGMMVDIFRPFFTTKQHGLGMGLAVSRSMVEAHGGRLWAENPPGGGALFQFELPCADGSPAS